MTTSPIPDRVTAIYDALDAFQRQHRTVGGLAHAQIRALLAEHLDKALPALPPPTDRAAVLREAADRIDGTRDPFPIAVQNGITWATAELRRLAAEAQPADEVPEEAYPAEHTWRAELYDPLAKEWASGTRYVDRDRAVNALAHGRRIGPAWKDGTPTERRLVRATTTYTVEPDGEQP